MPQALDAGVVALGIFRGSGQVLLINYIFVIFHGGGGADPLSPSEPAHRTLRINTRVKPVLYSSYKYVQLTSGPKA